MLFGCVAHFVVFLDRFRSSGNRREVPPANHLGPSHRNVPCDRDLNQRRTFRVECTLDHTSNLTRLRDLDGKVESERLRDANKVC